MKKYLLITVLMLITTIGLRAQSYNRAIGLRAGWATGLTFKKFISETDALEGIISSRWKGMQITGLYERHVLTPTKGLDWYYGAGAHIGFWRGYKGHPWFNHEEYRESYTTIGIDGILGMQYKFQNAPINISLDYKPSFELFGYTGFWGGDAALSIRYCF